jgi:DNA-directed RNA polymerase subunit RPC12/RpoP
MDSCWNVLCFLSIYFQICANPLLFCLISYKDKNVIWIPGMYWKLLRIQMQEKDLWTLWNSQYWVNTDTKVFIYNMTYLNVIWNVCINCYRNINSGAIKSVREHQRRDSVICNWCSQKILVLAFQMEEFSRTCGWGELE